MPEFMNNCDGSLPYEKAEGIIFDANVRSDLDGSSCQGD
jgi:hypothetical protein